MKRIKNLVLLIAIGLCLTGCSQEKEENKEQTYVTVQTDDGQGNKIDVEFPENADKIVVLNYQTLDFLDAVGMGDKIVGMIGTKESLPEHLVKYLDNKDITLVGTGLKDIDVEKVQSLTPDIIFSSDRTKANYDLYSQIAPTFCAYVDYTGETFMDGFVKLASSHATIFGVSDKVDEIIEGYTARINAIKEVANGQSTLLSLVTGGSLNTLGDEGRLSIITRDMGFTNLSNKENVNHGDASSFETYLEVNPDWIFVLDKDAATSTDGTLAKDLMNNSIMNKTNAYKNNQIVYLQPGNIWYMADGGITGLDAMITCVENALGL